MCKSKTFKRTVLVLDQTTSELGNDLEGFNFRVLRYTKQPLYDIVAGRIIVTRQPQLYLYHAPVYDFGIISLVPIIDKADTLARIISEACTEYDLPLRRHAWICELRPDGQKVLRELC